VPWPYVSPSIPIFPASTVGVGHNPLDRVGAWGIYTALLMAMKILLVSEYKLQREDVCVCLFLGSCLDGSKQALDSINSKYCKFPDMHTHTNKNTMMQNHVMRSSHIDDASNIVQSNLVWWIIIVPFHNIGHQAISPWANNPLKQQSIEHNCLIPAAAHPKQSRYHILQHPKSPRQVVKSVDSNHVDKGTENSKS